VRDPLRVLSDALVDDPASLVFLELADRLLAAGDIRSAWRVAVRGRDRHPRLADAHDLVGRIAIEADDALAAASSWAEALRLDPTHLAARKGLAFVAFREGRMGDARAQLVIAQAQAPHDPEILAALAVVEEADDAAPPLAVGEAVPAPPAAPARPAGPFGAIDDSAATLLLLGPDGEVLTGHYADGDVGRGVAMGRALGGTSDEATRVTRLVALGAWRMVTVEGTDATLMLAPAADGGVVLGAAPTTTPKGALRRVVRAAAAHVDAVHAEDTW